MKKSLHFLIVGLAFCLCAGIVSAKHVDETTARRVAENCLRAHGMANPATLVNVTAGTPFTEFYIFAAPQGGFAIVSADNCVRPILGYSTGNRFETKQMPEHIASWLKDCEAEIRHYSTLEAAGRWQAPAEITTQWSRLISGVVPPAPKTTVVSDTLLTKWSQGMYYNMLCPDDTNNSSGHPYTGCVATAMAQVMKFWNWPTTGYGDHGYYHLSYDTSYGWQYADFGGTTYQWDSMPVQLTAETSPNQDSAVALLMYHCGVSVDMGYGMDGSGAYSNNFGNFNSACQENALFRYFKYSPALHSIYREDFSYDVWVGFLKDEIDAHRPVLYGGSGPDGGHAFVLDGYNDDEYFHVNWGWSGSCDGFYPVGGLNPARGGYNDTISSTMTFNNYNRANIGVQPNLNWGNGGIVTMTANDPARGNSATYNYSFGDTIWMSPRPTTGYRFNGWIDGSPFINRGIYGTGGDYTFAANYEPIGTDTMILYAGGGHSTSYGYGDTINEFTWGIRLDSSYLELGRELHTIEFYVAYPGEYGVMVYLGTDQATNLMFDTTIVVDSTETPLWKTVTLGTPVVVDGWESMWVGMRNTDVMYPAAVTRYSGIDESFLTGSNFRPRGEQYQYSSMIRSLFRSTTRQPMPQVSVSGTEQVAVGAPATFAATGTPGATVNWILPGSTTPTATGSVVNVVYNAAGTYIVTASIATATDTATASVAVLVVDYTEGDTVSYCLDRNYYGNVGEMYDTTRWGIMLPHKYLHSRDTLQDVLLYVTAPGDYTLDVYQGGDNAPVQLVYSNTYTFDSNTYGYVNCTPATPLAIDTTQNLWITFMYPIAGVYPANGSYYMGDPNSDWYFDSDDGRGWGHLSQIAPGLARSWFIKAVTSAKPATYTVTVNRVMADNSALDPTMCSVTGEGTYTEGETVTLTATGTPDATDFLAWVNANGDSIAANPYTFVINSDVTLTAVFRSTVGIDGVETPNITLYPNPATESVTVGGFAMPATVTAIDLNGRECGEWKTEGVELSIDLKGVAAGEYFLRIVSGGTTTVRKLVVK